MARVAITAAGPLYFDLLFCHNQTQHLSQIGDLSYVTSCLIFSSLLISKLKYPPLLATLWALEILKILLVRFPLHLYLFINKKKINLL